MAYTRMSHDNHMHFKACLYYAYTNFPTTKPVLSSFLSPFLLTLSLLPPAPSLSFFFTSSSPPPHLSHSFLFFLSPFFPSFLPLSLNPPPPPSLSPSDMKRDYSKPSNHQSLSIDIYSPKIFFTKPFQSTKISTHHPIICVFEITEISGVRLRKLTCVCSVRDFGASIRDFEFRCDGDCHPGEDNREEIITRQKEAAIHQSCRHKEGADLSMKRAQRSANTPSFPPAPPLVCNCSCAFPRFEAAEGICIIINLIPPCDAKASMTGRPLYIVVEYILALRKGVSLTNIGAFVYIISLYQRLY